MSAMESSSFLQAVRLVKMGVEVHHAAEMCDMSLPDLRRQLFEDASENVIIEVSSSSSSSSCNTSVTSPPATVSVFYHLEGGLLVFTLRSLLADYCVKKAGSSSTELSEMAANPSTVSCSDGQRAHCNVELPPEISAAVHHTISWFSCHTGLANESTKERIATVVQRLIKHSLLSPNETKTTTTIAGAEISASSACADDVTCNRRRKFVIDARARLLAGLSQLCDGYLHSSQAWFIEGATLYKNGIKSYHNVIGGGDIDGASIDDSVKVYRTTAAAIANVGAGNGGGVVNAACANTDTSPVSGSTGSSQRPVISTTITTENERLSNDSINAFRQCHSSSDTTSIRGITIGGDNAMSVDGNVIAISSDHGMRQHDAVTGSCQSTVAQSSISTTGLPTRLSAPDFNTNRISPVSPITTISNSSPSSTSCLLLSDEEQGVLRGVVGRLVATRWTVSAGLLRWTLQCMLTAVGRRGELTRMDRLWPVWLDSLLDEWPELDAQLIISDTAVPNDRQLCRQIQRDIADALRQIGHSSSNNISNSPVVSSLARSSVQTASSTTTMPAATLTQQPRLYTNVETFSTSQPPASTSSLYTGVSEKTSIASNRTSIKSNTSCLGGAIPERVRVKVEAQSPPTPHHRTNSSIIDITTVNSNHHLPTGNISASANKKTQPAKNTSDKITYQFDRILAKRRKPNQHTALNSGGSSDDVDGVDEFLIKWRNYGSFYNVWLPRNQVPPEACHVLPSFEHWWDEQSVARQKRLRQLYDQQLQLSRQTLVRCKQTVVRRRASDGVPRGRINTTFTTTSGGDATVYTSTAAPFGTGNVCSTTPVFPLTTTTTTTTAAAVSNTDGLQSAARIWPRSDLMPVQSQPSSITSTSTRSMSFLPSNPTITTIATDSVNRATFTPAAFDGSTELSAAALAKLRSVVKEEVCDDSLHVVDDDDMLQSLVESTIDDQHTAISSSGVGDGGTCGGDDEASAMIADDNSGNLCEASPIVRILSRRYNTALQRVEYLVKWRGSSSEPSSECKTTWEPVEVITNGVNGTGIHLLQQFDRQAPISWRTTPKALGISGTASGVFTAKLDKQQQQHSTLVSSDSNTNNSAINRMLLINQKRQQQQQQLQYQSEGEPSVDSDSELIPPSMLMVTMTEGENHQLLQHQEKSQQEDEQQQKEEEEDELSHATAIGQKDYTHWLLRPDSDGDADVSADDTPAVTKTIAPPAASTSVAATSSSASSFSLAGKSVKSASLVSSSPTSSSVKTIGASPTPIGGEGSCVSHPVNAGGGVRDNCASIATKKRAAVLPATRVNDAKRSCPTPVRLPLITTTATSTATATSESIQSLVHSLKQRAGIVCSKITNVPATTANSTSSTSSNVTDTVSISIKSEPSTVTSVSSRPALVTVNARGRVNKLPLDGVSSQGKPQILRKIIVPKHRMPSASKLPTHSFENDCNVVVIAGSARTSTNRFGNENMARCRQKRRGMRCYRGRGACARSKHTQRRATMSASSRPKPNWLSGWYTRGSSATARASSARSAISASSGVSARSAIPASSGVSPRSAIYPRSAVPASSAVSPRPVVPASSAVSARSVVPALSAASDSGARKVQRPPADSIFRRRPGRPPLSRNKHFVCSQRRHSNASGNTATPADTVAASGKPARRHGNTQLPVGSVETILARRVVSSAPTSPQLLVKWKNFNRRYCTWEQEDVVSSSSSVCSPRQTTKLSHHEGGEFTVSARDIPHSAEYEESSPGLSRRSSLPAVSLSQRGRLLKRMRPASGEKRLLASSSPRSIRHNRARRSSLESCQFGGFSVYDLVSADHAYTCTNCCRIKTSSAKVISESVLAVKSNDVKKVYVKSSISKDGTLARGRSSAGTPASTSGTVAASVSSPLQPRIADIVDERLRVLTMWLLNNSNKQQPRQSLHPECDMIVGAPSERCEGGDGASAALKDAGGNEQPTIQSTNTKFVIKPDITDNCPTSVDSAGSTSSAKARDIEEFGNHTSSCSQLKSIDIGVDSSQSSGNNNNNNNSGKLCVNLRVCKDNADDSEQDCETKISTPDVADAKTDIVVRSDLCVEGAGTTAKNLASTAEGVGSTAEGVAPSDKGVVSTTKEIGFTGQDVAPIAEGVGSTGEHVASTEQDVAPIAEGVGSTGEHVASTGQDVPPIAKGVGSTSEHVASTGQDVAPIAKGVGSTSEHVASTGQDVPPIAEGVGSTGEHVASTGQDVPLIAEGVASSEEGIASTAEHVASAAERIASSDKDVASTDKGVSSTDRGIVSSDEGVASIDKGISSSDEGKVSLDGKKLHKQQQCSAQPSPNKTATDRQSTPPPTIPSTGHADIVSKPCTVSTTPVPESSLTKGVTFSSVTTVVKAEKNTAIDTGLLRKITTTNTSGISRQVALSSSPLRKSIRSYSANSIAVAKSDQRLNSGERSQLADDSLTTFSAEILQRFTSRFSSPGNIPCKSGNSERAASDTSMLLSCLDECAIDVWRSHQ